MTCLRYYMKKWTGKVAPILIRVPSTGSIKHYVFFGQFSNPSSWDEILWSIIISDLRETRILLANFLIPATFHLMPRRFSGQRTCKWRRQSMVSTKEFRHKKWARLFGRFSRWGKKRNLLSSDWKRKKCPYFRNLHMYCISMSNTWQRGGEGVL